MDLGRDKREGIHQQGKLESRIDHGKKNKKEMYIYFNRGVIGDIWFSIFNVYVVERRSRSKFWREKRICI